MNNYKLFFWLAIGFFTFLTFNVGMQVKEIAFEKEIERLGLMDNLALLEENLDAFYETRESFHSNPIFEWPMVLDDYQRLTDWYGLRDIPTELYKGGSLTREHEGIDIKGEGPKKIDVIGFEKARIKPVGDGEIISHHLPPGWHNGRQYSGDDILGGKIIIDHKNGWFSVYGHMDITYVHETQWVTTKDIIGRQGNTGMSTGPHLHFELWYGWENPVQPLIYLKEPL